MLSNFTSLTPWKFHEEIYNSNFKSEKSPEDTQIYQTANLFFHIKKKKKILQTRAQQVNVSQKLAQSISIAHHSLAGC